jgi:hypothetical protein
MKSKTLNRIAASFKPALCGLFVMALTFSWLNPFDWISWIRR